MYMYACTRVRGARTRAIIREAPVQGAQPASVPGTRPRHADSNPATWSRGERPERAAEGGERVAVCAMRYGKHDARKAATPLQRVEHLTPQVSYDLRAIAENAAAPRAQYNRRAASSVRRIEHVTRMRRLKSCSYPTPCRGTARGRRLFPLGAAAVTTVTGAVAGSREENGGARVEGVTA